MLARLRTLALVSSLVAAPAVLTPQSADAALNAYISSVKGEKQGEIKGGGTQKGREGAIKVVQLHHEIVSPRDAASGLPTGKRTHKPFRITVAIDAATPKLLQAMLTGERLTQVVVPVFGKSKGKGGAEVKYYEIKLSDAMITSYRLAGGESEEAPTTVTLELVYQKIEWTWVDGGITASDDWEAPVAKAAPRKPTKAQ